MVLWIALGKTHGGLVIHVLCYVRRGPSMRNGVRRINLLNYLSSIG